MKFEQIQPPAFLKDYVRYFWILENDGSDTVPQTFGPIADGSPGLMFQYAEGNVFRQDDKELSNIFLYGQTTKYNELQCTGKFRTIGVYFQPTALRTVFGLDAEEWTDNCLDLSLLPKKKGAGLYEQLVNTPSLAAQVELICSYLFSLIRQNRAKVDGVTQYTLSQIFRSNGGIPLKDLQADLHLTERTFERRFKQSIGISPKLFSRVCRFQASLDQLRNNQYVKISDIAYENGYADQSHFIRVFKEFAGISPLQYQKQSIELVQNFPKILKEEKASVIK